MHSTGWIVVENTATTKDVSLAYHAIIRQAADVRVVGSPVINNFVGGPTEVDLQLINYGAGMYEDDLRVAPLLALVRFQLVSNAVANMKHFYLDNKFRGCAS